MNDSGPFLSGFFWFLGVTLFTGSGILGIIAAVIAFNSAKKRLEQQQRRMDATKTWQERAAQNRQNAQNAYKQGYQEGYTDANYQTQPYQQSQEGYHSYLRPDEDELGFDPTASYDVYDGPAVQASSETNAAQSKPQSRPLSEVEREAAKYIASLRLSRSEITNKDVQAKIAELEQIVLSIYARLNEKPEQTAEVRAFMGKSMPLTTSVLDSYSDMAARNVRSEEFIKMENEVLGLLDTTKKAYTKLYSNMYDGDIMDVTSEISVLKTMLSQEGLLESEMMAYSTAAASGAFETKASDPAPATADEDEGEMVVQTH